MKDNETTTFYLYKCDPLGVCLSKTKPKKYYGTIVIEFHSADLDEVLLTQLFHKYFGDSETWTLYME